MDKIEEVEKLIEYWKAEGKAAYNDGDTSYEKLCCDRAIGLESALDIFKRPSNTQLNHKQTGICSTPKDCDKAAFAASVKRLE
ncbi:MAG: hypothetical protein GY853_10100 [PVC group bacterium]|nr:hypothetical protein [PVC group bacterium]